MEIDYDAVAKQAGYVKESARVMMGKIKRKLANAVQAEEERLAHKEQMEKAAKDEADAKEAASKQADAKEPPKKKMKQSSPNAAANKQQSPPKTPQQTGGNDEE